MMISQCRRLSACLLPGHFQIRDVTQSNIIELHHHRTRDMQADMQNSDMKNAALVS
jgi:hypothetical protein